jgi:peroxiredoxin
MNQMQHKYAGKGLQIIAINLDTESSLAKNFLDKVPAQIPIIYDSEGNIASDYQLISKNSLTN